MENKENQDKFKGFEFSQPQMSVNILQWALKFLRYWWLFVVTLIVAFVIAYFYNKKWQPSYVNEAKIMIESGNYSQSFSLMQGFNGGSDYLHSNNQLLILGSFDLIDRTLQKLPFTIDYYVKGRFRTESLYSTPPIQLMYNDLQDAAYGREFHFIPVDDENFIIELSDKGSKQQFPDFKLEGRYGDQIKNVFFTGVIEKLYLNTTGRYSDFYFRFRNKRSLEDEFAYRLNLSFIGEESSVVSVKLISNVPARDADFINMLCDEYIRANLDEKNLEAVRTIEFINNQLQVISDSLDVSGSKLRQFRRENNILDVSTATATILQKMNALDEQRAEMDLKEAYFKELSQYLESSVNQEIIVAPSSIGISDPVLLDLVSSFNELQQQRSDIGEKNPNYERYTKRMEEVKTTMKEVLANVRKIHKMERDAFNKEYSRLQREFHSLPEKELSVANYERNYKINDSYYTYLLQKQSEAQIRKASNVSDNKILQYSRCSLSPVNGSDKTKSYILAFVFGLAIPSLIVIILELMNNKLYTENDVKMITRLPIIGQIRHTDNTAKVASVDSQRSLFTEGLRLVRTRIEFITRRKSKISLMVSSPESGDGKTHFVINLAGVYSLVSSKVLLIDLDLRNPQLSKRLGMDKANGLVNVLIGDNKLEEVIVPASEEVPYDILPVGTIPPNPAELLRSDEMKNTMDYLKTIYDYVIVDTSPLGLVSDSYAISSLVDANLFVVRVGKTDKTFFRNFIHQMTNEVLSHSYIIINDIPKPKHNKKYGYGYGKYSYAYSGDSKYYHSQSGKYYVDDK